MRDAALAWRFFFFFATPSRYMRAVLLLHATFLCFSDVLMIDALIPLIL